MDLVSPTDGQQIPAIVPLKFWKDHEPSDVPGELKAVDWVEYAKKGQNGATVVDKISRIKKSQILWDVLEQPYERWLKGQEEPEDGTPLSAWPGVTRGQVDALKAINIRTVEDVAMLTDSDLERVGMGARDLRKRALAFVETQMDRSALEALRTADRAEMDSLLEQVRTLTETVEQLTASKPRRGRQPKDAAKGVAA